MAHLENKTALITGASAGIGAAAARVLRSHGARLVLNARRADRLEALAKEVDGVVVAGDVTDDPVRAEMIDACGGRIDILVNNAGYAEPGPVEIVAEENYRRQFEVNVFAVAALIQRVLPAMRKQRSGRIINISSVAGHIAYPIFGWYCASKHAIEGLSDALRLEVEPWGVHVVLIEPGPVQTEFFDVAIEKAEPQRVDKDSPYAPFYANADRIEKAFLKRAVAAEEVAAVIARACLDPSPKARYAVSLMAKTSLLMGRVLPRSWLDAAIRKQFFVPAPADVS